MSKLAVINVVGLSMDLIGQHTPHIQSLCQEGEYAPLKPITPAVTCSAQSTYLTGSLPTDHGCVANGWYFRDLCQPFFWRQSNKLVHGKKVWEVAKQKDPEFTTANMFWWYNMYSSVDYSATPRPMYLADGQKVPDIYTNPASLREELQQELGTFPLFHFWGPKADIKSSLWIAEASKKVIEKFSPNLTLVYLPHLDYNLQRLGPNHPDIADDLREIDNVCGDLIHFCRQRDYKVVLLSEYNIYKVSGSIDINRHLRRQGWITVREEKGLEVLDPQASTAFALADHQIAHVYIQQKEKIPAIKKFLESVPGIEFVLDQKAKQEWGLDHNRSGELIALSTRDKWFSYYYWEEDSKAPDFARTVDIHRKPGYDPVELFIDPKISLPMVKVAGKLLRKKLGQRVLMDVIPLDTSLVCGSHGRIPQSSQQYPVWISSEKGFLKNDLVLATEVKNYMLDLLYLK